MTNRRVLGLRRRRTTDEQGIPQELTAWFAGESKETPWCALLHPDVDLLPKRWSAWKAKHRFALPPAGFEWLTDPLDPRNA